MEKEKEFSEKESLQLISRMIHEAKGYFYETGIAALVYGFSILFCCVLAYLLDMGFIRFPFHPFFLLIPVFFIQGWIQYREEKKKKAKTFTDEAIDYIWTGFFLSVFAAFCATFAGHGNLAIIITLFLMAFAAFLTGMVAKFRYLIVCSFACWIIAIVSFFVSGPGIYLLLGLESIGVWIIPGFILNATFKKLHHDRRE